MNGMLMPTLPNPEKASTAAASSSGGVWVVSLPMQISGRARSEWSSYGSAMLGKEWTSMIVAPPHASRRSSTSSVSAAAYGVKYRAISPASSSRSTVRRGAPLDVRVYTAPMPTSSISSRASGNRSGSTTRREWSFTNCHGVVSASAAPTAAIRSV